MSGNSLWASPRLLYRAFEPSDTAFMQRLYSDGESFANHARLLPRPTSHALAEDQINRSKSSLLSTVICLPPSTPGAVPQPIGCIGLGGGDAVFAHHRDTSLAVVIDRDFQRQGYGTEAILWALEWALVYSGLHRVEISAFGWNEGALRLYPRLGFTAEGRKRSALWHEGAWWDHVSFGMLREEWADLYGGGKKLAS